MSDICYAKKRCTCALLSTGRKANEVRKESDQTIFYSYFSLTCYGVEMTEYIPLHFSLRDFLHV